VAKWTLFVHASPRYFNVVAFNHQTTYIWVKTGRLSGVVLRAYSAVTIRLSGIRDP